MRASNEEGEKSWKRCFPSGLALPFWGRMDGMPLRLQQLLKFEKVEDDELKMEEGKMEEV